MFELQSGQARPFVTQDDYDKAQKAALEACARLDHRTGPGVEWLGWQDILADPNDALLEELDTVGREIHSRADVLIVCGIGGSYLGARAVIEALSDDFSGRKPEIIYAGHHLSGRYLQRLVDYLDQPGPDGSAKQVYINVISKSGTTIETALAFRVLRMWMHKRYGDEATNRIFCTTSRKGGALNRIIDAYGYKKFVLPDDVGGRFSVLTPVGLLPVAAAGKDIKALFYGAVTAFRDLRNDRSSLVEYAATRFALHKSGFSLDLIATFEPALVSMGGWLQQLYGESEGKNGKGLFPAVARYSTDLHSLGQMVQDGRRNIMETYLEVSHPETSLYVKEEEEDHDGLNYLTGKSFEEINEMAFKGTCQAHRDGGVPIFIASMSHRNAGSLGQAIYYFMEATAVFVYMLGENPFDQPGVEAYKKAMYELLGK